MKFPVVRSMSAAFLIVYGLTVCGGDELPRVRPESWARPVLSERLSNWYRLDGAVYRASQPSKDGFKDVSAIGIKSVLNLRDMHGDEDEAEGQAVKLYRVKMNAGSFTREEVMEAMRILKDCEKPVLVHCYCGSDRTGVVCAMYRVLFHGWSKDAALDELLNGGYGFHSSYTNIPEFVRDADVGAMRKELGLEVK